VPAIALECLHRTMWVYVYRIRSESNDKTQGTPRGSGSGAPLRRRGSLRISCL
jgi:hypothetical protein